MITNRLKISTIIDIVAKIYSIDIEEFFARYSTIGLFRAIKNEIYISKAEINLLYKNVALK